MVDIGLYDALFTDIVIPPAARVLDVGCFDARSLCYMKDKYKLSGDLLGIDKRSKHFDSPEAQKALGVRLTEMNASEKLAFPNDTFDFIFHKDALECIADIDSHIRDLHRILKPGGQLVCVHRDWESIVVNGSNKKLINKAIYEYANFLQESWMDQCDGWMGRRLFGLFNRTELFKSSITCYNDIETAFLPGTRSHRYITDMSYFIEPKGFLKQTEYDELLADVTAAYSSGEYFFSMPFYIYKGVKK